MLALLLLLAGSSAALASPASQHLPPTSSETGDDAPSSADSSDGASGHQSMMNGLGAFTCALSITAILVLAAGYMYVQWRRQRRLPWYHPLSRAAAAAAANNHNARTQHRSSKSGSWHGGASRASTDLAGGKYQTIDFDALAFRQPKNATMASVANGAGAVARSGPGPAGPVASFVARAMPGQDERLLGYSLGPAWSEDDGEDEDDEDDKDENNTGHGAGRSRSRDTAQHAAEKGTHA